MTKDKEVANIYRGVMVILLVGGTILGALAIGAAAGWAVGAASGAALCFAWGFFCWKVARTTENGETGAD